VSENAPFLPEPGELVVSTVKKIAPYGAYVALDEFNDTEGLLHISEISSRWVKNIRDHVREGCPQGPSSRRSQAAHRPVPEKGERP
jgi:translation initiation factor 2 alpha subunit (eIF-2alpha)